MEHLVLTVVAFTVGQVSPDVMSVCDLHQHGKCLDLDKLLRKLVHGQFKLKACLGWMGTDVARSINWGWGCLWVKGVTLC